MGKSLWIPYHVSAPFSPDWQHMYKGVPGGSSFDVGGNLRNCPSASGCGRPALWATISSCKRDYRSWSRSMPVSSSYVAQRWRNLPRCGHYRLPIHGCMDRIPIPDIKKQGFKDLLPSDCPYLSRSEHRSGHRPGCWVVNFWLYKTDTVFHRSWEYLISKIFARDFSSISCSCFLPENEKSTQKEHQGIVVICFKFSHITIE